MNPYLFLYYLVYKLIFFTTPKEKINEIEESTIILFSISIFFNLLSFQLITKLDKYLPLERFLFFLIFSVVVLFIYFINRYLYKKNISTWLQNNSYFKSKLLYIICGILYLITSFYSFFYLIW